MDNIFGKRLENNKPINPLVFGGKPENPISSIENGINSENKFAITQTTEGGKYIRGNLLYFSLKGVSVYTELKNVIFVDLNNNSLIIKEYEKAVTITAPEDPENRRYIILYSDIGAETSEEEFPLRWVECIGRTNTYENIKSFAPIIDIDKSYVLVDTVALKDSLTVREFVKYLQNSEYVNSEEFNIDDYSGSEYI